MIKKISAVILAMCVISGMLFGCAKKQLPTVITFDNQQKDSIKNYSDKNFYDANGNLILDQQGLTKLLAFYAQYQRDMYDDYITAYSSYYGTTFDAYLKETNSSGKTYAELILEQSKNLFLQYLVTKSKAQELGITFSEEEQSVIDSTFSKIKSDFGDEKFVQLCEKLGITEDEFKEYAVTYTYRASVLANHYYGEGGEEEISRETLKSKFSENYRRFKSIILLKTTDSGESLSTDDLAAKKAKADNILQQANAGASFEDLIVAESETYTNPESATTDEDKNTITQANEILVNDGFITNAEGIYDSESYSNYNSTIDQSIVTQLFQMSVGESAMLELDSGFWIVKLYDLNENEKYFNDKYADIYDEIVNPLMSEKVNNWISELNYTYVDDVVNQYNPVNLSAVFIESTTASTQKETKDTGISVETIVIICLAAILVIVAALVILMIILGNKKKKALLITPPQTSEAEPEEPEQEEPTDEEYSSVFGSEEDEENK